MSYALRYYKDIPQENGNTYRLEIYRKDSTESAVEIGSVLRSLNLEIQGQQDDVDTPIVKTSLTMSFVDAYDVEDGKKNGNWEEFYTASSTEWKVLLKEKYSYSDLYNDVWGGYITPDSFSEDLTYHGSVTIIARDNIGHLQDFPFDAVGNVDGTIDLYDILSVAWGKIESPMTLDWFGDGGNNSNNVTHWLKCEGVHLYNARMNLSFFEGMNCYEAVEKALYSLGCVLRFIGRNRVQVCPLRDMVNHGYYSRDYFGQVEPIFVLGAKRELAPACKMVEEVAKYEIEEDVPQPQVKADDFTGVAVQYRCKVEGETYGRVEHNAPVWVIKQSAFAEGWNNVSSDTLFFDISKYETGYFTNYRGKDEEMRRSMYIAANNVDEREVRFYRDINVSNFAVRIKFGVPISIRSSKLEQQSVFALNSITYSVIVTIGENKYHYAGGGEWKGYEQKLLASFDSSAEENEFKVDVRMNEDILTAMGENGSQSGVEFVIHKIEYVQTGYASNWVGLYACIQEFAFCVDEAASLMKSNTIKTVYNEGNNVVLNRKPDLAPAHDSVFLPAIIKNGIFVDSLKGKIPAKEWAFDDGVVAELPVHIHKQILCYYSKPNNVISGSIVNAQGYARNPCNWIWKGKEHILMSGSLNLLNGHIDGAVLREFVRYEDMWNDN